MDPYLKFITFGVVFDTICKSPEFEVRDSMMRVIDKLVHPFYNLTPRRVHYNCWHRGDSFHVNAGELRNFKLDLKRVKLAEKLKIV